MKRIAILLMLALSASTAYGGVKKAVTFDEISSEVDVVVRGKVESLEGVKGDSLLYLSSDGSNEVKRVGPGGLGIYTRYSLTVIDVLDGSNVSDHIVLWRRGGELGEEAVVVNDGFLLAEGDEVIMALRYDELNDIYWPYGAQGSFIKVFERSGDQLFISMLDRNRLGDLKDLAGFAKWIDADGIQGNDWARPPGGSAYYLTDLEGVFRNEK